MATKIQELLDNLLHKKLGRDVRQSIHDSIEQCYKDATGHPESVAGVIEENKNMQKQLDSNINTINGRIDTILTGTVNTTKLVTVHSATIRNNSASDLTFKISSKDNETLKSIKDKSPTVINANVIAKALDGVAINGKGIPSSYNVESTNDEYVITVYSGSSSVVGQYVFMAVVTIAYEDIATDISSAELKDVRVGTDGITYESAGAAVRQQIGSLKSDTCRIKKSLRTTYVDMNLFALGTINKDTGEEESSNKILRSIIDVNATEDITIKLPKGYQWNVAHWLAGKYRSDLWNENDWNQNLTIGKTMMNYKYRILIRRSDGADITLSELIGAAETNREDLQSFDKIDDLNTKVDANTTSISELKEDLGEVVQITETKSTNKLYVKDVEEQEKNGVTMSLTENIISLNGVATATAEFTIPLIEYMQDGSYRFYYELLEGEFKGTMLYGFHSSDYAEVNDAKSTTKITVIEGQNRSKLTIEKGKEFVNCKFHIWAELSDEATGVYTIPGTITKEIAYNENLEIPQVKKNRESIVDIEDALKCEQNYDIITGKMVFSTGEIKDDTNSLCVNINMDSGDTIVFSATASPNYAIISEATPDFKKIINIIKVGESNDEMTCEYTADDKQHIILSFRSTKKYNIEKKGYIEKIKQSILNIVNNQKDYKYLLKVLEGKKGLCVGDSLTHGVVNGSSTGAINTTKNYPYWLTKITNLELDVIGHPGWTATQMYDGIKANDYSEYGFVLLFLGTNGGLTTDAEINAYNEIIKKFIDDDVEIFLITPFTVNNFSKQDTNDTIYKIGKEKEIAVINADVAPFKYTIVDGTIHEYDVTHLSEMGYFLLANVIANGMGKGIYDYLYKYNEC